MRIGFLGIGGIGGPMALAAREAEGVELVACASRDVANAKAFAIRHEIPHYHANLDEMLADESVDAIYIATPSGLHAEQTKAALAAGKHVLVEKPMALTAADGRAMVEQADAAERVLGVGFHLRHHRVLTELKRRIDAGDVGKPALIRATWGMPVVSILPGWKNDPQMAGGGSWMGFGVHVLDVVCWMLGGEPDDLTALSDGDENQLDRTFVAALRFGECMVDIQVSRRFQLRPNGVQVYGEEGTLEARDSLTVYREGELRADDGTVLIEERGDPYRAQLENLAAAIRGERPFHADGRDGLRCIALSEALIESNKERLIHEDR